MFLFCTIVTKKMKSIVYLISRYSLIIFAKSGELKLWIVKVKMKFYLLQIIKKDL
jgi:hypothetical protein